MGAQGSLYREKALHWPGLYGAVREILGSTASIFAFGDPLQGKPSATTFTTIGDLQATVTWSEAPSAFDTPLDLTDPANWQGAIPILTMNGSDEEADTPDAAGWSNSGGDFSVGAWINMTDVTNSRILAKWDTTTASTVREFIFFFDSSDYLNLIVYDEANSAQLGREDQTAFTEGVWVFVVGTFDDSEIASSDGAIDLYWNGVVVDDADDEAGAGFADINDTAEPVALGHSIGSGGTAIGFFNGKMAGGPLGPFYTRKLLTADEITYLYLMGRHALAL